MSRVVRVFFGRLPASEQPVFGFLRAKVDQNRCVLSDQTACGRNGPNSRYQECSHPHQSFHVSKTSCVVMAFPSCLPSSPGALLFLVGQFSCSPQRRSSQDSATSTRGRVRISRPTERPTFVSSSPVSNTWRGRGGSAGSDFPMVSGSLALGLAPTNNWPLPTFRAAPSATRFPLSRSIRTRESLRADRLRRMIRRRPVD